MKKNFTFMAISAMGFMFAQTGKVGINTSTPTEIQDINGTVRVRDLPLKDTEKAIYTTGDNTTETTKTTKFSPTKTVVVDDYGVLGVINGLPSGTQTFDGFLYSGFKDVTTSGAADSNEQDVSDAVVLTSGCFQYAINPLYAPLELANKIDLFIKIKSDSSCPTQINRWQVTGAGAARPTGAAADYDWDNNQNKPLTQTTWTKLSGFGGAISDDYVRWGEIVFPDQHWLYGIKWQTRLKSTSGTGPYYIAGTLQRYY